MSFSDILNKLAEKKAIQGNSDFAYRLISVAEKMEKEKEEEEEETKAEMIKRGRDKKASTLEQMIHKYAGKNYKKASNDLFQEAYDDVMYALIDEAAELGGDLSIEQAMNKIDSSPGLLKRIQSKYRDKVADLIYKSKGEMKDKFSSLNSSNKYAGKEGKGSFKNKIKEMDGFLRMDGKAFCFQNNAQAKKALGVAEQAANFLNWQVMKGDGCFKLMEVGRDKKASTLDKMIHKYAFDLYELGMSEQNEPDDQELFDFLKKNPGYFDDLMKPIKEYEEPDDQELFERLRKNPDLFKESSLKKLIKKYAKEDWEISSEEAYEPFVNTDADPLQFDDIYDAMGKGFEDGKRDPDTNKNPYDPVKHDDSLVKAYNDGFETAASDLMGRGSY